MTEKFIIYQEYIIRKFMQWFSSWNKGPPDQVLRLRHSWLRLFDHLRQCPTLERNTTDCWQWLPACLGVFAVACCGGLFFWARKPWNVQYESRFDKVMHGPSDMRCQTRLTDRTQIDTVDSLSSSDDLYFTDRSRIYLVCFVCGANGCTFQARHPPSTTTTPTVTSGEGEIKADERAKHNSCISIISSSPWCYPTFFWVRGCRLVSSLN